MDTFGQQEKGKPLMNLPQAGRRPEPEDRGLVEKAKRLLMARFGLTDAQANAAIRQAASDRRASVIDVAREVLETGYLAGLAARAALPVQAKREDRRPQRGGRGPRGPAKGRPPRGGRQRKGR